MFTTNPRNQWYDRNPLVISLQYNAIAGPPNSVVQATYTVPATKKFMLQFGTLKAYRQTVAGAAQEFDMWLSYTKSGGSQGFFAHILSNTNTVLQGDSATVVAGSMILLTGDKVTIETLDGSTGGTIIYLGTVQGIEFDA